MSNHNVPVLGTAANLSDEQVIAWYDKHPNPLVRELVQRLKFRIDRRGDDYEQGFRDALDSVHNLLPPKPLPQPSPYNCELDELFIG